MMNSKTALITGASRGLGLALARALAGRGWNLIIDGRGADALEAARSELDRKARVVALTGDVNDSAHRQSLAEAARALDGLDLLVNNASSLGPSPQPGLLYYPLDALEEVYRTNVLAPLGLVQAVRELLKPGARVINVSSDAGVEPYEGWGGYGSSKAALEQLSAILAVENPAWKVYWVDPGDMRTQMQQEAYPGEDISDRPLPEESLPGLLALIEGDLPSGRYQARELHPAGDQAGREQAGVGELRVSLAVSDLEAALELYQDGLGLPVIADWDTEHGRGLLLAAGRATLELLDPAHAEYIDRIEAGERRSGSLRLAFEVADPARSAEVLSSRGAALIGSPHQTPWGDTNARLEVPGGLHITLFHPQGRESLEKAA
jgi:NAD(P)-dependent dehydrogenase (short-subunit alcohol dehydrogenase family)/catechol 2,3-dioxygenase-like lactoylglutathione lyase family enzyme